MRKNKSDAPVTLLKKIFLILCFVSSVQVESASQFVTPDPGVSGSVFTFELNLDGSLPSNYSVSVEHDDSGWATLGYMSPDSSRVTFTHSSSIVGSGTRSYRYA